MLLEQRVEGAGQPGLTASSPLHSLCSPPVLFTLHKWRAHRWHAPSPHLTLCRPMTPVQLHFNCTPILRFEELLVQRSSLCTVAMRPTPTSPYAGPPHTVSLLLHSNISSGAAGVPTQRHAHSWACPPTQLALQSHLALLSTHTASHSLSLPLPFFFRSCRSTGATACAR